MADKTLVERLQPSLLDRLTDDDPGNVKEGRDARAIDMGRLREIVQRDLSWLLNTNSMESAIDASAFPQVVNSVLNYGVREVSGEFSTAKRAEMIRKSIAASIARFEPRIQRNSILVELHPEEKGGEMFVAFDIRADMWAQPVPLELFLRSKVDVTTGEVSVERRY